MGKDWNMVPFKVTSDCIFLKRVLLILTFDAYYDIPTDK